MRKTTIIITVFAVACFLFFAGIGLGLFLLFAPVSPDLESQSFVVTKGDTITSISQKLVDKGLLRSALSLRLLAKLSTDSHIIQPGTYKLSPHMSPREMMTALLSETQDVWVTLKEGWRSEEMAQTLASKLHETFDQNEFITLAKPVEGKLFPDTYLLSKDMNAQAVFAKLTSTFEDKYQLAMDTDGQGILSKKETIILASLVEREGLGEVDSRTVAGILINRLNAKMPLQVDATLQYAKGFDQVKQSWWVPPKSADKETDSPYNTYLHPGLPPTPICNPGLLSLRATLAPKKSDYLYYLHDAQGKAHYATTYEEHQKNIELYLR
jgi:UPF0755 protein